MHRLITSIILVFALSYTFGQCGAMCDSSDVSIVNRAVLTEEIFHAHIMNGWTKMKQNTVNQKLGIGAFNMSMLMNTKNRPMATTRDSSQYSYKIHGLGQRLDSTNGSLQSLVLKGDFSLQVSNNLFEISITSWDWGLNERYIYGYLDSKNYLFIGTSSYQIDLNEIDSNTVSWMKFYQSGYSVFNSND